MAGGSLIQHVKGHDKSHNISFNYGKTLFFNSSHHQMMYPFNLNKENYKLIAWSTYFQSPFYLNGNNENIKLPNNFLEPEIVYYKNIKSLCIQGHPEWENCPEETVRECLKLIEKYL